MTPPAKVTPIRALADSDLPWEVPATAAPATEPDDPETPPPQPVRNPQNPSALKRSREAAAADLDDQRPGPPEPPAGSPSEPPATDDDDDPPFPFTLLGHDHGLYYYLGHGTGQVTCLKDTGHTPGALYRLAPQSFWSRRWSSKRGFDADTACSDLITAQHRVGIYDPNRLRGRGCWWDKARGMPLVHLGDRLLVGGREVGLHESGDRYIYEAAKTMPVELDNPLTKAEARKLAEVCSLISWENPASARLLAGWIVCAAVCGALRWKPNVWVTGPARSGKSTIVDSIVAGALGENRLAAVGGTTEASLRNLMRQDALPIVLDDLDSRSVRGRENNQAILALMRVFSSEDGGGLYKGSQTGNATTYKVHSCYIFCSIVVQADETADTSRIAILRLAQRKFQKGQLEDLKARIAHALPPDFAPRLFARVIRALPDIRINAETFGQAIGEYTGNQRTGDVFGHLYAGAYALHADGLISPDAARIYVGTRSEVVALMQEERETVTETHEGGRCLSHLMEQTITDTDNGRLSKWSVFDLVQQAQALDPARSSTATYLLKRHGILFRDDSVLIANDHTALRGLYRDSAWPHGWAGVLKTVPGASCAPTVRFDTRLTRATCVPLSVLVQPRETAAAREPGSDDA